MYQRPYTTKDCMKMGQWAALSLGFSVTTTCTINKVWSMSEHMDGIACMLNSQHFCMQVQGHGVMPA